MSAAIPPKLAIIGCGAVVQRHILPALLRIGWPPAALIDPSPQNLEAAGKIAGQRGKIATAADWTQIPTAFDAALVAAPHALHGPIGIALAEAGKHIFMEKPLAITAQDGERILDAARQTGALVSVGLLRRYLQITRWTKALVESGVLGTIRLVRAREGFVFNWATSTDGLLRPEVAGGGVLMDTGAHTVDQLLWWLGDATVVGYRDDSPRGIEADCEIDLLFNSGASGRLELSRRRDLPNTCRIEGDAGFVEVHLYRNEVIACSDNVRGFVDGGVGIGSFREQTFPELFSSELSDFRTRLTEGTPVGVSGEEGLRSVALIGQCYGIRQPLGTPWLKLLPSEGDRPVLAAGTTVAITGATGFIGGRLAEILLDQGVNVRCLVRAYGTAVQLARLPLDIQRVDLSDRKAVEAALDGVDVVFHCAYDPRSPNQNLAGMSALIDAAVLHRVKRFVFLSTISVYEPLPDGPLTEASPDGNAAWPYTGIKLKLEALVREATRTRGLPATILQPTIVYGPFSKPWTIDPAEKLLYGTVILPDQGEGLCSALHVDDLVDAMILAAERPEAVGERFLVSGPDTVTWRQFFEAIADAIGTKRPAYRPSEEIGRENSGLRHDLKLIAKNPKKIVQLAVRNPTIRNLLQSALDSLPPRIYDVVYRAYYGGGDDRIGQVHLPNPQLLRLFTAKATVESGRARQLLGYAPRIGFAEGMASTAAYLAWAYGGVARPHRAVEAEPDQQADRMPTHAMDATTR